MTIGKFWLCIAISFVSGFVVMFIYHKINEPTKKQDNGISFEEKIRKRQDSIVFAIKEKDKDFENINKRFDKIDSSLNSEDRKINNDGTKQINSYYKSNNLQHWFDSVNKSSGIK